MKERSWIVVANAEKARVYQVIRVGELQEISSIEHANRAKKGIDLISDRPGRNFNRVGISRHAYEPQTTEEDKKDLSFARELAEFLNITYDENRYGTLYLIAEPHFLGILKKHLSHQVLKILDKCFAKDLVNQNPNLIWEYCEIVT